MRRADALAVLAAHGDEVHSMGVVSLALFGPIVRDEPATNGGIDIIIEVRRPFGLFDLARLERYLEALLGHPVNLVTAGALQPREREQILREAVRAA